MRTTWSPGQRVPRGHLVLGWLACGVVAVAVGASLGCRGTTASPDSDPAAAARRGVRPFFETYCIKCHNDADPEDGVSFTSIVASGDLFADLHRAHEVEEEVEEHAMPPEDAPQPSEEERAEFIEWVRAGIADARAATAADPVEPGWVTVRRLSRAEYANTVRDLVGEPVERLEDFPVDNLSQGFDNLGEALTLSPLHLEKYLASAERIAARALLDPEPAKPTAQRVAAVRMVAPGKTGNPSGDGWYFFAGGEIYTTFSIPRDGDYVLRARAGADQAGPEVARMAFRANGRNLATVNVPALRAAPAVYEHAVRLKAGSQRLGVSFANDFYNPRDPNPRNRDRNLLVSWVELVGPVDRAPLTPLARAFQKADPGGDDLAARAGAMLGPFVSRAFRRPVAEDELQPFVGLVRETVAAGEPLESGLRLAVTAVLTSPSFLFRAEPPPADGERARTLDDHEIATRLSYFLWSSLPDEHLFERARAGGLQSSAERAEEVRRMIADPRAAAFSENFAAQWLELRNLDEVAPDPRLFPDFDDELRHAMRRETELFVDAILREGRPVRELLDAEFTFVNGRLARHYGLAPGADDTFRRVRLDPEQRGGLLTHASILTLTSNPNRTSPVKRGKWVLDNLLDDPPPPPPPEAGNLDESPAAVAGATFRERLAQHRSDPACATCHVRMDVLGFALEGFGPLGRARTHDGAHPVEDFGHLPDGREVRGAAGLRALLSTEPKFVRCVVKKLLTFAVGRGMTPADDEIVERIVRGLPQSDPTLMDVINGIVESPPFLQQGSPPEESR